MVDFERTLWEVLDMEMDEKYADDDDRRRALPYKISDIVAADEDGIDVDAIVLLLQDMYRRGLLAAAKVADDAANENDVTADSQKTKRGKVFFLARYILLKEIATQIRALASGGEG